MNIIFSNYDDLENPYYHGGGAHAIHEIAKRLAEKNNVTVITGRYRGSQNKIKDKVFYKRIGLSFTGPKISQIIYQLLLHWYILTEKFDVWVENFTPPFPSPLLPYLSSKPLVGMTQLLNAKEIGKKYNLPFFESVENLGIRAYKYFISVTEVQKQRILSVNRKAKVKVIPNGITIHEKLQKDNSRSKYFLFVGRIDIYHKGLDLLLSAFSLIQDKTYLTLVITGDGLNENLIYLKELIASHNLKNRVKLTGFVDGKQKDDLYRNCEFAIFPSRFEGFGLVILEAFSFNKPVIIFKINDLTWVPDSVSLKVDPFSIEKLRAAILSFSNNPGLVSQKSKNVSSFIKNFNWEKITKKYEDYLRQILINKT